MNILAACVVVCAGLSAVVGIILLAFTPGGDQ